MRIATLVLCLLLPSPVAHAATSTVRPGDNLPAAIARLQPGDTLILGNGSYPVQLHALQGTHWPSGTASQPITIKAATPGQAVLNPAYRGETYNIVYVETAQYLTFDGLVFDMANVQLSRGGGAFNLGESTGITIQNSIVRNGSAACSGPYSLSGCGYVTAIGGHGTGVVLRNNELYNFDAYGVYWMGHDGLIEGNDIHDVNGYCVHVYNSGDSTVSHNIVRKNRCVHNGWNNRNPAGSCGIVLASGSNNVACGNTVQDHDGCGVQVYSTAVHTWVFGNTISGTVGPAIQNDGSGTVFDAPASAQNGGDACGGLPFSGTPAQPRPAPTHLRALPR